MRQAELTCLLIRSELQKETDRAYKWLTSDKRHLKKNCKQKPPYDWSDIFEKSKDEAMIRIAQSGDPHTRYYWNLAAPTEDCPNWIARWFLYHKFRYRDGRNRNPVNHHKHANAEEDSSSYYVAQSPYNNTASMTDGVYFLCRLSSQPTPQRAIPTNNQLAFPFHIPAMHSHRSPYGLHMIFLRYANQKRF
jgi:hypothetical protein